MKKIFFLFIVLLTCFNTIHSQSVDWYFIKMPVNLLPTLPENSKKDLVDFFKNDRTAVMPDTFGGEMNLKILTGDYLLLQTSQASGIQLKMLPVNDSVRVIALINTAYAPLQSSIIRFYDTDWKLLKTIKSPEITCLDFFDIKGAGKELSDRFEKYCIRLFVKLDFEPRSTDLIATQSIKEDSQIDFPKEFLPYLKDSIKFHWIGGQFSL
jgi:hypothetical protein